MQHEGLYLPTRLVSRSPLSHSSNRLPHEGCCWGPFCAICLFGYWWNYQAFSQPEQINDSSHVTLQAFAQITFQKIMFAGGEVGGKGRPGGRWGHISHAPTLVASKPILCPEVTQLLRCERMSICCCCIHLVEALPDLMFEVLHAQDQQTAPSTSLQRCQYWGLLSVGIIIPV